MQNVCSATSLLAELLGADMGCNLRRVDISDRHLWNTLGPRVVTEMRCEAANPSKLIDAGALAQAPEERIGKKVSRQSHWLDDRHGSDRPLRLDFEKRAAFERHGHEPAWILRSKHCL